MKNNLYIRPVTETDAATITEIYNYYIEQTTISFETEKLSVQTMLERIRSISDQCPYFVVADRSQKNERVVGFCYAHPWKERIAYCHTFEVTIYLDANEKGRGVGTMSMSRLVEECRKREDCHALIACITEENTASVAFHKHLGFKKVSHFKQVGYKFNRWLDVVDMELVL